MQNPKRINRKKTLKTMENVINFSCIGYYCCCNKLQKKYYLTILSFIRLKSRCWQGCIASQGCREKSVLLPFSVSRNHLLLFLWPLLSSNQKEQLMSFPPHTTLTIFFPHPSSHFSLDAYNYIGHTCITRII